MPHEEKMRRLHAVEALQERIAAEINAQLLDSMEEVLVEGEKDGVLTGRSRTNKLVHFRVEEQGTRNKEQGCLPTPLTAPALGELVPVRITRTSPWALQGEMAGAPVPA